VSLDIGVVVKTTAQRKPQCSENHRAAKIIVQRKSQYSKKHSEKRRAAKMTVR
jgi:hypothetical protein